MHRTFSRSILKFYSHAHSSQSFPAFLLPLILRTIPRLVKIQAEQRRRGGRGKRHTYGAKIPPSIPSTEDNFSRGKQEQRCTLGLGQRTRNSHKFIACARVTRDIGLIPARYDTTPCLRRCVCAINDREASIMKTGRALSGNSCERRRTVGCRVGSRETRETSSLATLGKACLGDICFIYSLIFHLPLLSVPPSSFCPLFITTWVLCDLCSRVFKLDRVKIDIQAMLG